ncbi:helix-hairpin-helix domain-containing protein [Bdellovibrio sp. HCB2-146]|uniref:helix-hairpin-helix domain-containing protein n=1 Tax=Bdellovibrio sp. HCB2-146 TaxID=3394362 RepID=UPI0039BC83C7
MDQTLQSYLARIVPTVSAKSAQAVIELAAEGATVPFIARYRKEKTGNLDEVQIRGVIEGHETFNEIVKRKAFLIKEIGEQNNLTAEIQKRIELSWDLGELEEIYKPFKKKKKTKATIAREAGLEPLAQWIWDMGHGTLKDDTTMEMKAKAFLNPTAKIVTYEEALKGAQDIIVEKIANDADLRAMVAKNYNEKGRVIAKAAKGYKPNSKFEMYKEFEEPVKTLFDSKNNHRYLAMRRGWQEEELSVDVKADDEDNLKSYEKFATSTPDNAIGEYLKQCARLALNVYVLPSVVNEVHRMLKEKADEDAIKVFAENVRQVLLGSPFGPKCVLGVDPGLRTGCKIALIDKGGNFISHTVLYTLGDGAEQKAKTLFGEVMKQITIEAIAVGNGTAGRETEAFIRKILKELGKNIPVVMVNESGASVYSASEAARQEFPDLDVTVKGAISIARRLQDPLAELVKIDPKSIGVGQYQHDVSQTQLKKSLEAVVESCVNNVGVDVNTASAALLSHVAGIGPALANGIVEYRKKNLFADRTELLKVPKFSAKVFEQAAGFLRIPASKQVLDSTGIHPERYQAVTDMAKDLGVGLSEIIGEGAKKLLASRTKWAQLVGEFTFDDIVKELEKPGRDPRDPFKAFQFRDDIFEVKDLQEGMICPGIVTNVTNFGAFVDIGVHQDGLVHISALSHKFVDDPRKVVNPGDHVTVKVLKVDQVKNQISLTMKMDDAPEAAAPRGERRPDQNRGPRPQVGASASKGSNRAPAGAPGKGPGTGGARPQAGGSPFNNPFAALMNTNTNKK